MTTCRVKLILGAVFFAALEGLACLLVPMPPAREYLPPPPGYTTAYRYEGALHLLNERGERRGDAPVPPKGERRRVLAIGDSYTLGFGVAEGEPWPDQLAALTGFEVINVGRGGATSRRVNQVLRQSIDLAPDVVVYAVCINDVDPVDLFLPGLQRYRFSRSGLLRLVATASALSIPEAEARYGDFARFRADVARMAALTRDHGARFVVSVFDNLGYADLVAREEAEIRAAGVEPVPFRLPPGLWVVSSREQHPNAEAHRRFAAAIARSLS